jgi:hypothetical protein
VKDRSGRLTFHSRRIENATSSPLEERKRHPPFSKMNFPSANNQSRLATCPFSENKSGLGSGVTTPNIRVIRNIVRGQSDPECEPPMPHQSRHFTPYVDGASCRCPVSGENFWASSVNILVLPSPTGYMLTSSSYFLSI